VKSHDDRNGGGPRRGLVATLVWVVATSWSVYLVGVDLNGDGGIFAVVVQALGSIGILYTLYLVTRPQESGVLEALGVLKKDVPEDSGEQREPSGQAARWAIVTITLALATGGFLYRLAQDNYLHQSAAFFIGVPAVLAITLALTPKAKSATGMIVKGLTLALLLSGVVFFEGFICILMAAPLFYLVGIAIGIPIDRARRRRKSELRIYSVVGIAMLLLSLEGVTPATSFSQHEVVRVWQTIDSSAAAVQRALARTPHFDQPLPFYLKLGFPRPVAGHGSGLSVGDRRTIVFGNESPMEPMTTSHHHHSIRSRPPGTGGVLELKIVRSRDGLVVFEPVEDATAFTHWITWGRSVVRWKAIDADSTEVTWTLHFERRLSPSWYFGPFQRYAGLKAVGYLIDTIATP
jgi:hypothetical protein